MFDRLRSWWRWQRELKHLYKCRECDVHELRRFGGQGDWDMHYRDVGTVMRGEGGINGVFDRSTLCGEFRYLGKKVRYPPLDTSLFC